MYAPMKILNISLVLAACGTTQVACKNQHMFCINYSPSNTSACDTWNVSGWYKLPQEAFDEISKECDRACKILDQKCEADVVSRKVIQYTCKPLDWERRPYGRQEL